MSSKTDPQRVRTKSLTVFSVDEYIRKEKITVLFKNSDFLRFTCYNILKNVKKYIKR